MSTALSHPLQEIWKAKALAVRAADKGIYNYIFWPTQKLQTWNPLPGSTSQLPETLDPQQKGLGFPYRDMKGEMIVVTKNDSTQSKRKWMDTLILTAQSTMTVIHRFPDPWQWINNCLDPVLCAIHPRKIARRESMKQLSATRTLNSISQAQTWKCPCNDTRHVKKLSISRLVSWCFEPSQPQRIYQG